jgi:hypothetical protein
VDFLIGSIRRERLDHLIACNQAHLMRILRDYASYYNVARTHLGLERFTPTDALLSTAGVSLRAKFRADRTISIAGCSFRKGRLHLMRSVHG